jgi:hypothetical protein
MTIQDELLAIKGDRELLTAEEVVSWAQAHPKSALYHAPEFNGWDIKKCAHEHWLWAARRLIAIHIVYADGERRFVSLTFDRSREGGGYRSIDDVLNDKSLHEIMLQDALRELERLQARYDRLKELKPVWRETRKVRSKATKRRGAKRPAAERGEAKQA